MSDSIKSVLGLLGWLAAVTIVGYWIKSLKGWK